MNNTKTIKYFSKNSPGVLLEHVWARYGKYDLGSFRAAVASGGTQLYQIRGGGGKMKTSFQQKIIKLG